MIRGKGVEEARATLRYLPRKSAPTMAKLLDSAVANARAAGASAESLVVKTVTVDKAGVMRRYRPFARGRSGTIRKTMSTVRIELAQAPGRPKRAAARPSAKSPVKKRATAKKASEAAA